MREKPHTSAPPLDRLTALIALGLLALLAAVVALLLALGPGWLERIAASDPDPAARSAAARLAEARSRMADPTHEITASPPQQTD